MVEPGNSGGPLLSPDGTVYGVVFAAAVGMPDTGFALTAARSGRRRERRARSRPSPISTQGCD